MTTTRTCMVVLLAALAGCARYHEQKLEADKTLSSFEERSVEDNKLQSFLATNRASTVESWHAPEKWDLDTLTLVAFYYHPSLDVARAQWNSATATIRTAAGRPNPTVGLLPGYNFNAANGAS